MDPVNQDANVEIKQCVVQLERLPMGIYDEESSEKRMDMYDDDDSSDSVDLPSLPYAPSSRKKIKSKKSSVELLKEHQNLAQDLMCDDTSAMEETIRRLEIVVIESTDDTSSVVPEPIPVEDNSVKILCVKDSLQFFNTRDVTPGQCGYDSRCHDSYPVHEFEKKFLSYKQVEFEHVISSFLYSATEACISDCKSFVTFLLRTLSVRSNIDCIDACYRTLVSLLDSHPDLSCLTFSSAEIFMLLFNYGADINNFKFLSNWTNIKKKLDVPQYENRRFSAIPSKYLFNLKYMLRALIKIISSCTFEDKELAKIIIFFMWLSMDSSLLKEDLYSAIRDCIYVCLEAIKEDKWNETLCNIVNALLSMESSSVHERWTNIYQMSESIPNRGKRGIELTKQISFSSLKCLCLGSNQDVDENCLGFHINELQFLIQQLVDMSSDLLKYASKFIDNCTKHLDATKEAYSELCDILKKCEASFSEKAQNEKTHFLKIYAKLSIFCGQKVSLQERCSIFNLANVKSESDISQTSIKNDYKNSPHFSENSDRDGSSFSPGPSENSQSCSTDQSDQVNHFSPNNVHIKSEYPPEQSCALGTVKKEFPEQLPVRKKRSSRSSSGNSFTDLNLTNTDIKCENEELPRLSSEFRCEFLNKDAGVNSAVNQNDTVDTLSGSDVVISTFSVEDPEEENCNLVGVNTEPIYNHAVVTSGVENVNIIGNEDLNIRSCASVNYINEDLFIDDQSSLPKICEVNSMAINDLENSPILASDLLPESNNDSDINRNNENPSSSAEASFIGDNMVLPMLHNKSESHIVTYEGGTRDSSVFSEPKLPLNTLLIKFADESVCSPEKASCSVASKQSTTSTLSVQKENLLDDGNDDIVFIEETNSPQKSNKVNQKKESISSSIQKYSKTHPEISITPVKNVPPLSVACENDSADNDDIVIIEEKTPPQKDDSSDVVFLKKVQSSSPSKSCSPHKLKNASPTTSKMPDKDAASALNSILRDIDIKRNAHSPSCNDVLYSILKQIDMIDTQRNSGLVSPCTETLNSVIESIDKALNKHANVDDTVSDSDVIGIAASEHVNINDTAASNSDVIDSSDKHLVSEDKNSLLTKESVIPLKNDSESDKNLRFLQVLASNLIKFKNAVTDTITLPCTSGGSNSTVNSDRSTPFDPDNDKSSLAGEICANGENKSDSSSSQNVMNNSQDDNDISDVNDKSLEQNKSNLIAVQTNHSNISGISRNSVKSPVINTTILESDVAKQTDILKTDASQHIITDPFVCSVSRKSDVNVFKDNETANQNVSKSPMVIPKVNDIPCSTPLVNSSEESVLQNRNENKHVFCASAQFKKSSKENVLPINRNKIPTTSNTKLILDKLIKSYNAKKSPPKRKKSGGSSPVAKKSCENRLAVKSSLRVATVRTSGYASPSSQIKRKRSWSSAYEKRGDMTPITPKKLPRKYSPVKSPLGAKYSSQRSPKKFFDYTYTKQKYKHFSRMSVLSKAGLNLTNVLRERVSSPMCNQENDTSDSDDSDIIELYTDPKRYQDKECIVVFESENVVVLD